MRLDKLLLERGLVRSRTRAQDLLKAGKVQVEGLKKPRPSDDVAPDAQITLLEEDHPYVSRGALKLLTLIEATGLSFKGKVVMDLGAAHGGFTQVALQDGAAKVYAVDVGTAQMDEALKQDPRLVSLEQTDARALEEKHLTPEPDTVVCDVSFISATLVLQPVLSLYKTVQDVAVLVKPQFELTPADISAGGVVHGRDKHQRAIDRVKACLSDCGFETKKLVKVMSHKNGNREFMLHATRSVGNE